MSGKSRGVAKGKSRLAGAVLAVFVVTGIAGAGTSPGPAERSRAKGMELGSRVEIEVLPGQREKIVDTALAERVPVAVLSSPTFDAREVDPATVVVSSASVAKREDGSLASFSDVNLDGRKDLVVEVASWQMRIGERSTRVLLTGRTRDGQLLYGFGSLRTMDGVRAERRRNAHPDPAMEKLPPVPVNIDILPGDPSNGIELGNRGTVPVAVLSDPGFDATALDPTALALAGSPVTRSSHGGIGERRDVNGDGRADLVVEIPKRFLRLGRGSTEATLTGFTPEGRALQGSDQVQIAKTATVTFDSDAPGSLSQPGIEFVSSSSIIISDNAPGIPYPSTISVSGLTGVISKVRVTLKNLSHTYPNDIDILLVGPGGQNLILMSDVGGVSSTSATLTFDDDAAENLDPAILATTGTYRPTDSGGQDFFPGPAPTPSEATSLSVFNGTNPNGVWQLYVVDDTADDSGSIDGWSVDFVMATEFCNSTPITINDNAPASPYPSQIPISGLSGVVSKATLTLKGITHPYPNDIEILLNGPMGKKILVMADVGGIYPGVSGVNLVLDDNAILDLTPLANPVNGTYRPVVSRLAETFPAPAPAGPYDERLSVLNGTDPNAVWSLYVRDDEAPDTGIIAGGWCATVTTMTPVAQSAPAPITIPAGAPGATSGAASPYPSEIPVSGVVGMVSKATVTLNGLSHTLPRDLDILLSGPGGQNAMLMSDVGGSGPGVTGVTLTFDDGSAVPISTTVNPVSGIYHPTNDDSAGADGLPAPAPVGPYGGTLSTFNGTDPNGIWSLYAYDDSSGDSGAISGGWSLTLVTVLPDLIYCNPGSITIPAGAPSSTSGTASIYPSTLAVSSIPQDLDQYKVVVSLLGLSHTFAGDLDILLQDPGGKTAVLMSDAGNSPVSDVSLTFDDDAAMFVPDSAPPVSGTYKPTNIVEVAPDTWPAPASAPPHGTTLSTFKGIDPRGTWKLFIVDDKPGDYGSLSGGWCIEFRPSIAAEEVFNLRWQSNTDLAWGAGANATSYNLYRGDPGSLTSLQNSGADSCLLGSTLIQEMPGLTEIPAPGSWYWYLIRGSNAQGEGPPGFSFTGDQSMVRIQNSSGSCP